MNLLASMGIGPAIADISRLERAPEVAPARASNATKHDMAGYSMVGLMTFMRWAIERDRFPTAADVQERFGVCRATAYRWTAALAEVYGIDPAVRHRCAL